MFAERLDFLMNLTHTSNNALAGKLNLTASYISRLRNGKRNLPKNPEFITTMSLYFAKNISTDEQKKTMERMLRIGTGYPEDLTRANELILSWLTTETDDYSVTGDFVANFGKFDAVFDNDMSDKDAFEQNTFLYTSEEKREGLKELFSLALNAEKPGTLLFYNDETVGWAYTDTALNNFMSNVCKTLLERGWKFKMIYTVNINLYEFTKRVHAYIPLVITGQVERYYCTRIYHTVNRRSLYVIPGIAALSANSVENDTDGMLAVFTKDKNAVKALEKEFNSFLDLCVPLGDVFSNPFYQDFWTAIRAFVANPSNLMMHTRSISAFFVPREQVEKISNLAENPSFVDVYDDRRKKVEKYLERSVTCEFVTIPTCDDVFEGKVPYTFDDLVTNDCQYFYEPADFAAHLRATVEAIKTHKNYHVFVAPPYMNDFSFFVKEGYGYFLCGHTPPIKVFHVTERLVVSYFWVNFFDFVAQVQNHGQELAVYEMETLIAQIEERLKAQEE